ncbi:MAG: alpha-amylase family glycosyl hydrolase [Bacteroidota bacterium]
MSIDLRIASLLFLSSLFLSACSEGSRLSSDSYSPNLNLVAANTVHPTPNLPNWARNANIYEVNIRQYTPEGTINAFARHLPRLKELGVDILWLMPIFPISTTKKKGALGSYYAVADYRSINPAFGSAADFKALVEEIHRLEMKVILDWVPNHTGWDHHWITEHPDWYTHDIQTDTILHPSDEKGKLTDWYDVAELNYDQSGLRQAMREALEYWVKTYDIDGYRMDVAFLVPQDFWTKTTADLRKIKPLFLLAESATPAHRNSGSFDMNYGWAFHHLMNDIAKGEKQAVDIDKYLAAEREKHNKGFYMHFTSNHDENSWQGSVFDRMGAAHQALAVLAATIEGMPLIYSGQEAALDRPLKFFEKDEINWSNYKYTIFYSTLLHLKKRNKALWNGNFGGPVERIVIKENKEIYAFTRVKDGDRVIVLLNLSERPQQIRFSCPDCVGDYTNVFANSTTTLTKEVTLRLSPWDFLVLSSN